MHWPPRQLCVGLLEPVQPKPHQLHPCGYLDIPTKTPIIQCQLSGNSSLFSRHPFHVFLTSFSSTALFWNFSVLVRAWSIVNLLLIAWVHLFRTLESEASLTMSSPSLILHSIFFWCNQIDSICYHGHTHCPIDSEARVFHPMWEKRNVVRKKRGRSESMRDDVEGVG